MMSLWDAITDGNVVDVQAHVLAGLKLDEWMSEDSHAGWTPLFLAAERGQHEVVRCLIEQGADFEVAQKDCGRTALIGACHAQVKNYEGSRQLSVVRYLLDQGADINKRDLKGCTALHAAAGQQGSVRLVRLLVERGAVVNVKDSEGQTPLLTAVLDAKRLIVDYLVNRPECTQAERVDALLLLGAVFLGKKHWRNATSLWVRALVEVDADRKEQKEGEEGDTGVSDTGTEEITKDLATLWCPPTVEPIAAFGYVLEARSAAEIKALSPEGRDTQAVLVRQRVLGLSHPSFFLCINSYILRYSERWELVRCCELLMYSLDLMLRSQKPLNYDNVCHHFNFLLYDTLTKMVDALARKSHRFCPELMLINMLAVLDQAALWLQRKEMPAPSSQFQLELKLFVMHIIIQLIQLIIRTAHLHPDCTASLQRFHAKLREVLVPLNPRDSRGRTLLHRATAILSYSPYSVEVVVATLVEAGMKMNDLDAEHNTPLHLLTKLCLNVLKGSTAYLHPNHIQLLEAFVRHGAHLDARDAQGRTVLKLLAEVSEIGKARGMSWLEDIVGESMSHVTLKCLAARGVVEGGVEYRSRVPAILRSFIDMH